MEIAQEKLPPLFSLTHTFTYQNLDLFIAMRKLMLWNEDVLAVMVELFVFVIIIGLPLFRNYRSNWWVSCATALVYLFVFLVYRFPFYRLGKKMALRLFDDIQDNDSLISYQLDFTEDGLVIHSRFPPREYTWGEINKVIFKDPYLYLYITETWGYAVPLSGVKFVRGGDAYALVEFVQEKVVSFR